MKTRSGVPEAEAYGPAMPEDTWWVITPKKQPHTWPVGDEPYSVMAKGPTAAAACAAIGITLGDVSNIRIKEK